MGIHATNVLGHVFTFTPDFTDPKSGQFTIASDMLCKWAEEANVEVVLVPCLMAQAGKFMQNNGLEPHRLARITEEAFKTPIVLIDMNDGTHTLVDGSHRYVMAAINGIKHLPARLIPFEQWQQFIVEGVEFVPVEELKHMFSGIA